MTGVQGMRDNGSVHDCLNALRAFMRHTIDIGLANLHALPALLSSAPGPHPPLMAFDPTLLAGVMTFRDPAGDKFLVLGAWRAQSIVLDGTLQLFSLGTDALRFDRFAAARVAGEPMRMEDNTLKILGEKLIVSACYVECLADLFQDLAVLNPGILQNVGTEHPSPIALNAVQGMTRAAAHRFAGMVAPRLDGIRALGSTVDLMALYPFPPLPALAEGDCANGEVLNGVWMPKDTAMDLRLKLMVQEGELFGGPAGHA